jgi:hypothetical protein
MWYLHVFAGFKRQAPTDSSGFLLTSIDSLTPAIRHGNGTCTIKTDDFPIKVIKTSVYRLFGSGISHGLPCLITPFRVPAFLCFAEAKCSVSQRGLGRTKGRETERDKFMTSNLKWNSTKNHLIFGFTLLYSLYNNYYSY